MTLLLFALGVLAVFLFGVLIISTAMWIRHDDTCAAYPLYAVRDGVIDAVVFKGLSRQDPWVESVYDSVTQLLRNSQMVAGPGDGWNRADRIGSLLAQNPSWGAPVIPEFPKDRPPPESLLPVLNQLQVALKHLLKCHYGLRLQFKAIRRHRDRIERAKALQEKLSQALGRGVPAFA
jgi:hypothetical protein